MKVLKFGGTSVGSAENIQRIREILKTNKEQIVVVSAFSGVTNLLEKAHKNLSAGQSAENEIKAIQSLSEQIMTDLYGQATEAPNWKDTLAEHIAYLNLLAQSAVSEATGKEMLAMGEIISSSLLQLYFIYAKLDCVLISALNFMRTGDQSTPDLSLTASLLKKELDQAGTHKIYLTQGYICRNAKGAVDNLQRGGSDYTATIIGACSTADCVEIWTDIDGLHNNDPRFVQDTTPVRLLSMDEAAELAYFGAKILHPLCLQPLQDTQKSVLLKNTFAPDAPGTTIANRQNKAGIKSIASKDGITAIRIKSARMLNAYGFLNSIFEVFNRFETPIDMITTSEIAVSLSIDDDRNLDHIIKEIEKFGSVEIDRNQSIVCIVGQNIGTMNGITSAILSALECINIRMISVGGSRNNISLLVETKEKVEVLNLLHRGIFLK